MRSTWSKITKSIYSHIFLSYLIIIFIITAMVSYFSYLTVYNKLEEKANDYNKLMIQSINNSIDSYLSELEQISFIVYRAEIHELLNEISRITNHGSWEYQYKKSLFFNPFILWNGNIKLDKELKSILVLDTNGCCYLQIGQPLHNSYYSFKDVEYINEVCRRKGAIYCTIVNGDKLFHISGEASVNDYLLVSRKIINNNNARDLGVLLLAVSLDSLSDTINNLTENANGLFVIMDEHYNTIYSSDSSKKDIIKELKLSDLSLEKTSIVYNGQEYFVNYYKSPSTSWHYLNILSSGNIDIELLTLKKITSKLIVFSVTATVLLSFFFAHNITKPITKLKSFVTNIELGDLDSTLELNSYHEFNLLARTINSMLIQLKEMINRNYILTILKQEAELKALQSQINPHFLYNTLNSISSYAKLYDVNEICEMSYALSDILRYSLRNINELVQIREEIVHIKNYIYIQNIRYNNSFKVVYNISPCVMECKTVRFILQPLVENAIYHGLNNLQEYKEIIIEGCKVNDESIIIRVTDNGIGIPEDKIKDLMKSINNPEPQYLSQNRNGIKIGIRNVHQRIKLAFGDKYGISIRSKVGEYTCFEIILPAIT